MSKRNIFTKIVLSVCFKEICYWKAGSNDLAALECCRNCELMKRTITVIFRRICVVAVLVTFVFFQEAKCGCRSDGQCEKFGETCCRNKCQHYKICEDDGHCLDNYDCVADDKICEKKRCVKENITEIETYCVHNKECVNTVLSRSKGFNICCEGRCKNSCSIFEPTQKSNASRGQTSCLGRECITNGNVNTNSTTYITRAPSRPKTVEIFPTRADKLHLNPAIVAAIVIAGCIVLTITCICFLREKRLMRKHSTRCRRHRLPHSSNTRNQPFWISRLARNSTQTRLSCGSRDEEATASFTQANTSGAECYCESQPPPSYSTLTIHECPPSYEEATSSHRNQGTQVDLFV